MERSVSAMFPANGICTLIRTTSLFFNMVLSSFGVTFLYEPPTTETLSPATDLDWQSARNSVMSKREKMNNFFMLILCLLKCMSAQVTKICRDERKHAW